MIQRRADVQCYQQEQAHPDQSMQSPNQEQRVSCKTAGPESFSKPFPARTRELTRLKLTGTDLPLIGESSQAKGPRDAIALQAEDQSRDQYSEHEDI